MARFWPHTHALGHAGRGPSIKTSALATSFNSASTSLRLFKVREHDRLFAATVHCLGQGSARPVDHNHIGAHIGQQLFGIGTRANTGQFNDHDAGERAGLGRNQSWHPSVTEQAAQIFNRTINCGLLPRPGG